MSFLFQLTRPGRPADPVIAMAEVVDLLEALEQVFRGPLKRSRSLEQRGHAQACPFLHESKKPVNCIVQGYTNQNWPQLHSLPD